MLKQVSIFAANEKGAMQKITQLLADKDINIWGSVTNDSAEYGIVRMIVSDPVRAEKVLGDAGYLAQMNDVMGIELKDEVGSLDNLLKAFSESNINVSYIYLSFNRDSGMPVMILRTEDIWEAEDCIRGKGFSVL